jgi:hypothetical protein
VGFQLLFSGIITIIKGVYIFLNIISNYGCARVFKLLAHLNARAYTVVLLRALHAHNLSLSRLPSCFVAAAIHKVSIEFPFRLSRDFKGGRVGVTTK